MKTNRTRPVSPHLHKQSQNFPFAGKLLALALGTCACLPFATFQAEATTPYVLTSGSYLENFSDIANWANNFTAGIGASCFTSVVINASGTIPDGKKITTATATFATGTSGGVQKGTGNIILLSTGASPENSTSDAIDLLLDCTGTNAGTLGFDYAMVANSTGDRRGSVRVYTSTDATTFTELTAAAVLNIANNVASNGSIVSVSLPASFSNSPTARIRFYYSNGTGGTAGSRPKISLDNLSVTLGNSVAITRSPVGATCFQGTGTNLSAAANGVGPLTYQWQQDGTNISNSAVISGVTSRVLTFSVLDATNSGNYTIVVSNPSGSVTSSPAATLSVINPVPVITTQPQSVSELPGTAAQFSVVASAGPPITYQWTRYSTNDGFSTNLVNNSKFSGATSSTLIVSNLTADDATDYSVIVTSPGGSVASTPPATLTLVNSGTLAQWDFNPVGIDPASPPTSSTPPDSPGSAVAVALPVGTTNTFITSSPSGGPSDPVISTANINFYWGSSTYPTNGNPANNKTTGLQFKVSTLGLRNVNVSMDHRVNTAGSTYARLQYTSNGTDFIDFPISETVSNANNWEATRHYSLVGFPGVANNANFAIRLVSELQNTATYGWIPNTNYVASVGYTTAGTFNVDMVKLTAEIITNGNTPPSISSTTNFAMVDTDSPTNVTFTISDAQNIASDLSVSATAYNPFGQNVLGASILNNGNGTATLTLTPSVTQNGVVPIVVSVTDTNGDAAVTSFIVRVNPGNQAPTISSLQSTNMLMNTTLVIPFTVGDVETAAGSLIVTVTNGNTTLLTNITTGGSGASRTLTIRPNTNALGATPITVSVTDLGSPSKTTSTSFALIVRPNTNIVFNDYFDYDGPGGALPTVSGGLWIPHSGSNPLTVGGGVANITDTLDQDEHVLLIGQPFATNSGVTLYSAMTVNFSALPSSGGTYFGHFMDAQTGAATGFGARLWASTSNALAGSFRIGIGNGSGATAANIAQLPQDLVLNSNYTIVTRFVIGTGDSTVWINPTAEVNGATATDQSSDPATVVNSIAVIGYAFRQSSGEGTLTVDNLQVGKTFASVVGIPTQIPLNISLAGSDAVLTWSNPAFSLASSTNVAGAYTKIPGATSPYTNAATGAVFFRLVYP